MTETDLKPKFKRPYSFDNWKPIYEQIFPKVDFFSTPEELHDTSNRTKELLHRGTVYLTDNKKLAILEAKVISDIQIAKNRVELRNIAAKFIDQYTNHGILIVYYSEDEKQKDYRFTFITKYSEYTDEGELIKNQTHPKRFTYVLGENESCTTAAKRFMALSEKRKMLKLELKDTIEAFSVETLTKEFYKKYYFFFINFCYYIIKHQYCKTIFNIPTLDDLFESRVCFELNKQQKELVLKPDNKPIRDYVKRLLGRIVFLHFLQKKSWLGCPVKGGVWKNGDKNFMQNLFINFKQKQHFHSQCLTELFFNTLNKDRSNNNDIFSITGTRVPYLNGGLFENDLMGTDKIDFPQEFFKDLFDFFEQYNFTIDENSPDEHEVGIDPEMLGHIFENLLEENKDKGAFYTPKEIVQYMCQESLIQYLAVSYLPLAVSHEPLAVSHEPLAVSHEPLTVSHEPLAVSHEPLAVSQEPLAVSHEPLAVSHEPLAVSHEPLAVSHEPLAVSQKLIANSQQPTANNQELIATLIRQSLVTGELQLKENARKLNDLLDNVKICDPAIGSGAFPIGLLQEIYKAKLHIYSFTKPTKPFNPADVKKRIIENSIYGVDIDKGAVDIARLRFWLALVVDEEVPQPLPNLDYKIMQGNSLLESFEGIDLSHIAKEEEIKYALDNAQINMFTNNVEDSQINFRFDKNDKPKVNELIKKYFATTDKQTKENIHKQIDSYLLQHISYNLKIHRETIQHYIKIQHDTLNHKLKAFEKNQKQKEKLTDHSHETKEIKRLSGILETLEQKRLRLELLETQTERPYFLWHLYFKDAFDAGGFDIVIGNPPYIQIKWLSNKIELSSSKYKAFSNSGDIYCLFYEKANSVLKNGGIGTFITSNKWLRAEYGENLRDYLLNNVNPLKLIDFGGYQVFDTATVDTNILIWAKKNYIESINVTLVNNDYNKFVNLSKYINLNEIHAKFNSNEQWIVLTQNQYKIKEEIEKKFQILRDFSNNFYYGILTGDNQAFLINQETYLRLIRLDNKNSELIKPILRGQDLVKFGYKFNNVYLIVSHNGIKSLKIKPIDIPKDYPTLCQYFDDFGEEFKNRGEQGDNFWNLRNCAYLREFEQPKIIYADIVQNEGKFYYDNKNFYTNDTAFIICGENLKYLVSILNSKIFSYLYKNFYSGGQLGQKGLRYKKEFIERVPVPFIPQEKQKIFNTLVDYVQFLKQDEQDHLIQTQPNVLTSYFEQIIDGCVYELYFGDSLKAHKKDILQYLNDLPTIENLDYIETIEIITKQFNKLYHPEHPVRQRLYYMDSVPEVRIIEGKEVH